MESGKRSAYLEFGRQYLEKNVVDIENNTTVLRRHLLPGENVDYDISSGEDIDVDSGSKENNKTKTTLMTENNPYRRMKKMKTTTIIIPITKQSMKRATITLAKMTK